MHFRLGNRQRRRDLRNGAVGDKAELGLNRVEDGQQRPLKPGMGLKDLGDAVGLDVGIEHAGNLWLACTGIRRLIGFSML